VLAGAMPRGRQRNDACARTRRVLASSLATLAVGLNSNLGTTPVAQLISMCDAIRFDARQK
jgi:hypothetical protein